MDGIRQLACANMQYMARVRGNFDSASHTVVAVHFERACTCARVRECTREYAKRARFESLLSYGNPRSSTLTAFTFSKFPTYKN